MAPPFRWCCSSGWSLQPELTISSFPTLRANRYFSKSASQCHAVDPIANLRHTKAEWKDIVDAMAAMGADATEQELNIIVDYLSKYFGKNDEQKQ